VTVRFGVITIQGGAYDALADRWHRVEELGWDSLWISDHTTSQYPTLIGYEAWSLMGALARETRRVRIGTLVTQVSLRHPVLVAMAASTIDQVSNGRLELGIGAGGAPKDEAALGVAATSPAERVARLEAQLVTIDRLLRGETVTTTAPYATTDAIVAAPVQRPRPPLVVAAEGPRTMAVAARHADAWNVLGGQPMTRGVTGPVPLAEAAAATRRKVETFDAACRRAGRDPRSIRHSVLAYRTDAFASVEAFDEYVSRFRELGIDEFIFYWPADPETLAASPAREAVMERVCADLLPRLRK
jgi:alkanesulfonate monooxygenase SsuD/methylene tetrahydromethanopterin reductase-like flavin-dependent oxidoreductase (luciferase family)